MRTLEQLRALAADMAAQAGVEVRLVHSVEDAHVWVSLTDEIWRMPPPANALESNLLLALLHTGSYASVAFDGEQPVGVCFGFWHEPAHRTMHSHIAGVRWERIGEGIGTALKYHQAVWLAEHDVDAMTWTFDPLVARNAYFNLVKLGVRVIEYLPDFYGPMNDGLNAGLPSDRLMVEWRFREEPAPRLPSDTSLLVPVPPDIEGLRLHDQDAALLLAIELRGELAPPLLSGWQVVGFDRASSSFVLERK
ncbi:MAG: GNAT family N-acetyltransferase [Propionibacteriaceae bacterium]|jgi:predicted GNAT superfamily acetyltransferase|nr:GNAT family N-acetyltransferase [Propionibacteriaceae bacterium]